MAEYKADEHEIWRLLYERQRQNLEGKAAEVFLSCLNAMSENLTVDTVPEVTKMEAQLQKATGWSLVIVPGLIPVEDFFELLSKRHFCTSTWVRKRHQFDYLEEPDMFHDTFGHIPPLLDPDFAEFMHEFGTMGWQLIQSHRTEAVLGLQRLYWYFVEFGFLADAKGDAKVIGAGIMSSYGETNHAWSLRDRLHPFDLEQVMHTDYRTDQIQTDYFVLDSIPQLREELKKWFKQVS